VLEKESELPRSGSSKAPVATFATDDSSHTSQASSSVALPLALSLAAGLLLTGAVKAVVRQVAKARNGRERAAKNAGALTGKVRRRVVSWYECQALNNVHAILYPVV
jgi:hypothetical protein